MIKHFLKKKNIEISAKRYFIDAMGAMALGLFASLLIGTIFNALGMIPGLSILTKIGKGAQGVAGPAMAVAIAVSLKAHPLVVYSCAAVGALVSAGLSFLSPQATRSMLPATSRPASRIR